MINKDKVFVNKIKTLIRHHHTNLKKKESIFKTCVNDSKIFHLQRVKTAKQKLIQVKYKT